MALGDVPSPAQPPSGCHFHPRCSVRLDLCSQYEPPVVPLPDGLSRCVLAEACRAGVAGPAPASAAPGAAPTACRAGTQTREPRLD
jgi:peptide/nickel transport system ATP-binding protein